MKVNNRIGGLEFTRYSEKLDQVEFVQGITQEAVFGVLDIIYDDIHVSSSDHIIKSISEVMDHMDHVPKLFLTPFPVMAKKK